MHLGVEIKNQFVNLFISQSNSRLQNAVQNYFTFSLQISNSKSNFLKCDLNAFIRSFYGVNCFAICANLTIFVLELRMIGNFVLFNFNKI